MYKIGITSYDNDHQLWETHIGLNEALCYSVWGETESLSRTKAELFIIILNEQLDTFSKVDSEKKLVISETLAKLTKQINP